MAHTVVVCWNASGAIEEDTNRNTWTRYTTPGADGAITDDGELMVKLPLEPQLARAMLASLEDGCAAPMLTAAAMLSVETLFMPERPPPLRSPAEEDRIKQKQKLLVCPPLPL